MRILFASTMPWLPALAGATRANRALAESLARAGHRVTALAPARIDVRRGATVEGFLSELSRRGLAVRSRGHAHLFRHREVEVVAVDGVLNLRAELEEQLRTAPPDRVVLSTEDWRGALLDTAVSRCPEKVVYIVHTTTGLPAGPHSTTPSRTDLTRVRAVLAPSQYVAGYLREFLGVRSTVYYLPAYEAVEPAGREAAARERVTLINPCALKGIDLFVGLAEALPDRLFAAVPTWGTSDRDRRRLEALPNVALWEASERIDDLFSRTRVLLVPSLCVENFPLVCVEAMLRGVPVLASQVGGLPEAKLGTPGVIPVVPIERYQSLDAMPVAAEVPAQDLAPWLAALRPLLADRSHYEGQSHVAAAAAARFVEGLVPFDRLLAEL